MNKTRARIVIGSYMFRYPLGGMLSWVLQYLTGFVKLGYDVYFVEKYGYPNSCYDPVREIMSDDCSYGLRMVSRLLKDYGLGDKWCFMDIEENYHGLSKKDIENLFKTADLFIDMGTHGAWMQEASTSKITLLLDGEPGFTQMKMVEKINNGEKLPEYDLYYTTGYNIGKAENQVPTAGLNWHHIYHPVDLSLFVNHLRPANLKFTTVLNWRSHDPIQYNGKQYGQKDVEFLKIAQLPNQVKAELELAISGKKVPFDWLKQNGWQIRSGKEITRTFESFRNYIIQSSGEFSICKNVFVGNKTGWFSDKSAAYLGSSKPVILQDTGFSEHLPCGEGLFSFTNLEEAKNALETVSTDYERHANLALEIAREYLSTDRILTKFIKEIGI